MVKSNATMKAVREALAAHLGKPELLKTCRLVQRVGENGAFSSFKARKGSSGLFLRSNTWNKGSKRLASLRVE